MAKLLLHLADFNEPRWAEGFRAALPGHEVFHRGEQYEPEAIDYIFIWKPKVDALTD
jgi:glyoxylate/hydroxypyruvate reductase A